MRAITSPTLTNNVRILPSFSDIFFVKAFTKKISEKLGKIRIIDPKVVMVMIAVHGLFSCPVFLQAFLHRRQSVVRRTMYWWKIFPTRTVPYSREDLRS